MSSRVAFTTQRLTQVLCHFPKSLAIQQSGRQFIPSRAFASLNRHSRENMKEKVVVIGTGWAGWTISQDLDDKQYDITVISPERTLALTPLLASASCGIFDFRYICRFTFSLKPITTRPFSKNLFHSHFSF